MTNLPDLSAFHPDEDDDLITLQQHANSLRSAAELAESIEKLEAVLKLTKELRATVEHRVKELVNDLFDLEISAVEDVLTKHKIGLPTKEYAFQFKVTAVVTRKSKGLTEQEAWENIDVDDIQPREMDDIFYDTRFGNYEYCEEIDSTPFNFREFLGR